MLHREMGLKKLREEAPVSFGRRARKEELVAPPNFFSLACETYHSYEVFLDYMLAFFIEMQGEAIRTQSFVILELVQCSEDFCFLDGSVKVGVVSLINLSRNMLEKGFRKVILVLGRGVQILEMGGGVLLDLGDVLKDFSFMGFEFKILI